MLSLLTRIVIYLPFNTIKNLFLAPTESYGKKCLWETGKGSFSHKLELVRAKIYCQEVNNGATHIFSMVFPYSVLFPLLSL